MTDRIEKAITIRAPRARVWRALVDRTEFGTWFRVLFPAGTFAAGESVVGQITHPGFEHMTMDIHIVEVVPEEKLSYRWHPYAIEERDYSAEPMTLVTFTLEDVPEGTRLTVVETGFDQVPLHRRDEAYRMNEMGWAQQTKNIERHVTASS
jgi:uncharacterized protein YndB with AHSA1/START domain